MTAAIPLPLLAPTDAFAARLAADGQSLDRVAIATLQLNIGRLCNLACHHCHVEAGPKRTELMSWETMGRVLGWLDAHGAALGVRTLDVTGGAPEMNPRFRDLVAAATARGLHVIDRCNLTILLEPGYEDTIDFLAAHRVEVSASLPCYLEDNVDRQRGKGVYRDSIEALRRLNRAGYGLEGTRLRLDLVYNPVGYGLPPAQASLEGDYKNHLLERFGIRFNRLWTITNMPIKRFEHALRRDGKLDAYMEKLTTAHRSANVTGVMCRSLVSVGWQGGVYDCDFNQMLQLPIEPLLRPGKSEHEVEAAARKLWEYTPDELIGRTIRTGAHCFGCTAGHGSSCMGALS